ncbi:MAG: hypothetical protein WAQ05_17625 [Rubrivivax sp.]
MLTLVDFVIAVLLVEALWLVLARRSWLLEQAPHLLAGLALLLALRSVVAGDGVFAAAAWLALAGIAHGAAVWRLTTRRLR